MKPALERREKARSERGVCDACGQVLPPKPGARPNNHEKDRIFEMVGHPKTPGVLTRVAGELGMPVHKAALAYKRACQERGLRP